jgi:hypothetical protein
LFVVITLPSGCWILHESARRYHWEGTGEFSIKSFFGGRANIASELGAMLSDDRSYLLLNAGQEYQITIESRQPVESFCLFFAAGFTEDVHRTLRPAQSDCWTSPWRSVGKSVSLKRTTSTMTCFPRLYSACARISRSTSRDGLRISFTIWSSAY